MKISPNLTVVPTTVASVPDAAGAFALAHRLTVPVWIFDIDHGRIVFANPPACRLWGAADETELRLRDLGADMSSTVAQRLRQYQNDFADSDKCFTEQWTLYPNGEPKNLMVVFRGYTLPDGRMAMQCEAIGESEDAPQNLRSAEALLHTDVMITLVGMDGPPLYMNPAARNALSSATRGFADMFVDPKDYEAFLLQIDIMGEHRLVTSVHTALGERWYDLSAKKCSDAATGQPAMLLTSIDVSELKEARDTARYLADRDQLTDLHNRSFLQSELSNLAQREVSDTCAMIFFDVDRFKQINDRHGHETGDVVLQHIARRISDTLFPHEIAARLGGDEFVLLLKNCVCRKTLERRIEELRQAISCPFMHQSTRLEVTVSVGVALFSPLGADFTAIMRQADVALYGSKEAGRNRTTFYSEDMGTAAKARDLMEIELKDAVKGDEFVLHYQPRLDLASGAIVGVEGLVRWDHPARGIIMPGEFIPICEENGLIEELGRKVLRLGIHQAIAWQLAGLDLTVSLNLSPRQFADDNLMETLADLAALPGFPAGKVELEITETVLVGDHQSIAEKLRVITEMGYRIAIDDFGTGYSNLSYISRFPLTCLKIDRSFIHQLPESGPIISLIVTLGKQIGAQIVSEGVETRTQMDWLTESACEQAQGYLIAKPMRADEIAGFVH